MYQCEVGPKKCPTIIVTFSAWTAGMQVQQLHCIWSNVLNCIVGQKWQRQWQVCFGGCLSDHAGFKRAQAFWELPCVETYTKFYTNPLQIFTLPLFSTPIKSSIFAWRSSQTWQCCYYWCVILRDGVSSMCKIRPLYCKCFHLVITLRVTSEIIE